MVDIQILVSALPIQFFEIAITFRSVLCVLSQICLLLVVWKFGTSWCYVIWPSDAPWFDVLIASMQLAVNVQIPAEFGGVGGHAVYVGAWNFTDCNSSLVIFPLNQVDFPLSSS